MFSEITDPIDYISLKIIFRFTCGYIPTNMYYNNIMAIKSGPVGRRFWSITMIITIYK